MLSINETSWNNQLKDEMKKEYFQNIIDFLSKSCYEKAIYPPKENIFKSLELVPFDKVKVVILGQDPYHGEGEAMGLAFSVNDGIRIPPSLRNIFKELQNEFKDFQLPMSGNLSSWANEGILLLNTTLTVEKDRANSHSKIGWQIFTNEIIRTLNKKDTPVVFLLWGNFAISKKILITNPIHLVLESPHPSPLSARRGFFGNNHFITTNEFLKNNGIKPINWFLKK